VSSGDRVTRRQAVVELETSKAAIEVEAEADGFIEILESARTEVAVGTLIGRIRLADDPAVPNLNTRIADSAGVDSVARGSTNAADVQGSRFSKRAQAVIAKHGLDPGVFASLSLVREADVLRYLAASAAQPGTPPANGQHHEAPSAAAAGTTAEPLTEQEVLPRSGLLSEARASARQRGQSMLWLAWNYLWRNWLLGNLVPFSPWGLTIVLHRWRGVTIGSDCYVDPTAILETAYPENITVGNDVRITARAVIMTHIKAPRYLRDNGLVPFAVKPVVLGDHCFIGVNAVLMPGVTIGKGAVVTSGAVVLTDVPPFAVVSGNPARVIRSLRKAEE
jgi:acetyltransferase-like isoleucine patch superfamily enzyme